MCACIMNHMDQIPEWRFLFQLAPEELEDIPPRVERQREDRGVLAILCIILATRETWNLPDQATVLHDILKERDPEG